MRKPQSGNTVNTARHRAIAKQLSRQGSTSFPPRAKPVSSSAPAVAHHPVAIFSHRCEWKRCSKGGCLLSEEVSEVK